MWKENSDNRKKSITIFEAALDAVNPYQAVAARAEQISSLFREAACNRLEVLAFGKAAFPMAKALVHTLTDLIKAGIVITKYGHVEKEPLPEEIRVFEAGHPIPDEKGFEATRVALSALQNIDDRTLLVCLISGGGSALLVAPYRTVSLGEKQITTQLLLRAGADIGEINAVRKHLSAVKGGRLAETAYPARVLSLILSDVIGDRLDVIASGPTAPDRSTYVDALSVVEKYRLGRELPPRILDTLVAGSTGMLPETPKEGSPVFDRVTNLIIGSNTAAAEAARTKAGQLGFDAFIMATDLQGEARDMAAHLADKAMEVQRGLRSDRKVCLIWGGETTVTVKGTGLGGRNTELALAFALAIEGIPGITFLSAGTDGTDGPTDAAGAIADGKTAAAARAKGLDPQAYLDNNDSYSFFKAMDGLFITGPTGTNVMDLQIVLIERPST
jgi:glycerate 2-kinase